MNARDAEHLLLDRCLQAATGQSAHAVDAREAHQWRVAAALLRGPQPDAAGRLSRAAEAFFRTHPQERTVSTADLVRRGWIESLPRLRDMLLARLERQPDARA